jgi:hypothetical protein
MKNLSNAIDQTQQKTFQYSRVERSKTTYEREFSIEKDRVHAYSSE